MRILVVEDERPMAAALKRALEQARYSVEVVCDGEEALAFLDTTAFDLVLLDVMLPGRSGFDVLATLRSRRCPSPVLMLTAREDVSSRVRGLDAGADDYLRKPFEMAELLARIRALLRRGAVPRHSILSAGDLSVDPAAMTVTRGGVPIALTAREYQLLELLIRNKNRVISREAIFESIWASGFRGTAKVVDVYVNYLRAKIDSGPAQRLLHTVRGVGYVLRDGQHADPR